MNLPSDLFRAAPFKLKDKVHHLGKVDISEIKSLLDTKAPEEWLENTLRQKNFSVHKDTVSIVLKWCANAAVDTPVETTRYYDEFEPLLRPVLDLIQDAYGYENPVVRKAMFAKLRAGGTIAEHVDGAVALRMVHRIHIPIVTNDDVHFFIDETDFSFKVGEVIEFDNTRFHAVKNDSAEDRIHLIVDYYHN
jgi:hypothetical protein